MTPRICIICGARVTNQNPKANTCDTICTFARDHSLTRERAQRLYPDPAELRVHPSFANRGEQVVNILPEDTDA